MSVAWPLDSMLMEVLSVSLHSNSTQISYMKQSSFSNIFLSPACSISFFPSYREGGERSFITAHLTINLWVPFRKLPLWICATWTTYLALACHWFLHFRAVSNSEEMCPIYMRAPLLPLFLWRTWGLTYSSQGKTISMLSLSAAHSCIQLLK